MLLYKITYQIKSDKDGRINSHKRWESSNAVAGKYRAEARQKNGYVPSSVQTVKINVPTNKVGLIKFLNSDMVL